MIKLKRRKKSQNFSFSFTEKKHLLKNLERSMTNDKYWQNTGYININPL